MVLELSNWKYFFFTESMEKTFWRTATSTDIWLNWSWFRNFAILFDEQYR